MKLTFQINYFAQWGEQICIIEGGDAPHGFTEQKPLVLDGFDGGWWMIAGEMEPTTFTYRYALRRQDGSFLYEGGDERTLIVPDTLPALLVRDFWQLCEENPDSFRSSIGVPQIVPTKVPFRGSGVAVPIFSLRSKQDMGIGEFLDLKPLADWAAATGQQMIQTLPINDTNRTHTNLDSYPYNALSVYALNPIYINIEAMGRLTPAVLKRYRKSQQDFGEKTFADYHAVFEEKTYFFRTLYKKYAKDVFASESYKAFWTKNQHWLRPYAAYMSSRDGDPVEYFYYVQYHADRQLTDAVAYVHSLGIAIKGDIPIGVCPDSVETTSHPDLFNVNASVGAPPDDFDMRGQNWGFPSYRWDEMAKDGYLWWRQRFAKMAEYFDAYRIDHILGFFRIWQMRKTDVWGLCGHFVPALPYTITELREKGITLSEEELTEPFKSGPYRTQREVVANVQDSAEQTRLISELCDVLFVRDQQDERLLHPRIMLFDTERFRSLPEDQQNALSAIHEDYFYHRHTAFWYKSAMSKLPTIISATKMLACGEDLGMVPDCVGRVMDRLKILSLEIQRMPKEPWVHLGDPAKAPYLSVCTTGTHDTDPIRAWWESEHAGEVMSASQARELIRQHMMSPAMWVILPLQDWLAIDDRIRLADAHAERINVPSDVHNFWSYRIHLDLEDLVAQQTFNQQVRTLTAIR